MINSNERLKHKYAYNINDTTKIKKITMGSGKDFLSLNRGFYDEIENNDINIKKKNHQLKKIKNESLKEFVFTNVQIPDKWRTKLDYQNSVIKILAKDNSFLSYVGRGGALSKNETSSTKMFTRDNFNNLNVLKKTRGMSTCYSQVFPQINKSKLLKEENKIIENKYKSLDDEDNDLSNNSNINSPTKIPFPKVKNKKDIMSEKDVANLLEEFKIAYPIKLPKEEEEQIEKIQERENKLNKTNLLFSQTFNYNQLLQKNIKYNAFDNFHKIRIKRQRAFRQNIFNNLIPPKRNKDDLILANKNKINDIRQNKTNKYKTINRTTSFLNSDYDIFYQKVKINNPVILKNLENINFYGPFYSYCPPCLNRNLDFYNNLEAKQCLELIHYLRKIRKKNILNIKGNGVNNSAEKKNQKKNELKENENNKSINESRNEKKDSIDLSY